MPRHLRRRGNVIDDLFPNLPFDNSKPGAAFRPYGQKAARTGEWLAKNALPIAGIILAVLA